MKYSFNLKAFERLPLSLKNSDYVDFLLFLLHKKPCLRLGYNHQAVYQEMELWCKENKVAYIISTEGFMYIAYYWIIANIARVVDDSTIRHAFLLGKIFGYPVCCSKKIASIGEDKIDDYEKEFLFKNKFEPPYHRITPQGYLEGYSLISHIPCCATCEKSLEIATEVYSVIKEYKEHPSFARWKIWFDDAVTLQENSVQAKHELT